MSTTYDRTQPTGEQASRMLAMCKKYSTPQAIATLAGISLTGVVQAKDLPSKETIAKYSVRIKGPATSTILHRLYNHLPDGSTREPHKPVDEREAKQIMELAANGMYCISIAKATGIHPATVWTWAAANGVCIERNPNRKALKRPPARYTKTLIACASKLAVSGMYLEQIAVRLGVPYDGLRKAMARANIRAVRKPHGVKVDSKTGCLIGTGLAA